MADVAAPDFILTSAAAGAEPATFMADSAPRSVEAPILIAQVDHASAEASTHRNILSQQQQEQQPAAAQPETDRMPTSVSDEPAHETRTA